MHLHESGFLLSFANWYNVETISRLQDPCPGLEKFRAQMEGRDFRAIFRGVNDDMVLLEMLNDNHNLWLTNWNDIGSLSPLEEPIGYFSEAFFRAMTA